MPCEQTSLMQWLAVEDNDALRNPDWQAHFDSCEECREERAGFSRSLAVFRQLESERISQLAVLPSWEAFSETLAQQSSWSLAMRRLRVPMAAAAAGLFLVAGMSTWLLNGDGPEPQSGAVANDSAASPVRISRPAVVSGLNFVSRRPAVRAAPAGFRGAAAESFVFEFSVGAGRNTGRQAVQRGNASIRAESALYGGSSKPERDLLRAPAQSTAESQQSVRIGFPLRFTPTRQP